MKVLVCLISYVYNLFFEFVLLQRLLSPYKYPLSFIFSHNFFLNSPNYLSFFYTTDTMTTESNDVRLTILMRLREELDVEIALAEQLLNLFCRFHDRVRSRRPEIIRVGSQPDHLLSTRSAHA